MKRRIQLDAFEFENRFEQMKERMPLFRLDENDIDFAILEVQKQFPIFTIFIEKNIRNCEYKFTFNLSNDLKNNVGIVKIDFFAPVDEIYDKLIEFCKSKKTGKKSIFGCKRTRNQPLGKMLEWLKRPAWKASKR